MPGTSEDTEWFSRPSEVSEALFHATSEVASDLGNSCFSVSHHPLIGSTAVESQGSFLPPEQGTKEETISSETADKLKTSQDSDSHDALCSYMSWKTQEVTLEPETNLTGKDQVYFSTSSDTSDEYVTPKESDSFNTPCSYVQYWEQKALQQSEKYLTSKDHHSCSDSSDTIDENKIPKGSDSCSAPFSCMPWSKQGVTYYPETCLINKDHVSFAHEAAPHFNNKMSYSFLHCLLEKRGKGIPLMSDSHYFESVYLRAPAENEVKQKIDSLEGYERNEEGLGKGLSQCFDLKENSNTSVCSEEHPRSSEIQYIKNVVVPDNSIKVSETHIFSREHDTSKKAFGGPLQTITSNMGETSEQLYFQEERHRKASSAFSGKNVNATENVAFEAVIASIEPSKKESPVNEIHTDINRSLTNNSQESEPKYSEPFLLSHAKNPFFDKLSYPLCQSAPRVFERATSKPLLHKKGDYVSSLYWHPNLKSLPSAPQKIFIKSPSFIPELKSSASLTEKSHSQLVGLCKTQSALFQCDTDNEPFLPVGKRKSVPTLDLSAKVESSNITYPLEESTSDSLILQDLKQQPFEEVADSSNYILGKSINSRHVIDGPSAAIGNSFSANVVAYDAKSQGASLITVGQETLLKADIGLGEIPWPIGAKSSLTIIHTVMQNDSYFVEGLQEKVESDICTLGDDTECCSLDENAVICSKTVAELQREVRHYKMIIWRNRVFSSIVSGNDNVVSILLFAVSQINNQSDLTGECIELAGLENLLDDLEICDSSLHWQSALQLPSKEDCYFEEPVSFSI